MSSFRVPFGVFVAALILALANLEHAHPVKDMGRLTIEQLIDIRHPSDPTWSPDGHHVAFIWDRAGVRNLYISNADGKREPTALTSYSESTVADIFWGHDSQSVYFSRGADLWQVSISGGTPRPIWTTPSTETEITPSPDGTHVVLVRATAAQKGSDLVVRGLSDRFESKVAHDDVSIENPVWSPDGSKLAYIAGGKIVHHDESPSYSGAKLIYAVEEYLPGQLFVVSSSGGKVKTVGSPGWYQRLAWV